MRILIAVLHHWNPNGQGRHASLRPDPRPRLEALQQQILAFAGQGGRQMHFDLADQAAYPANLSTRHQIHLHVVTDGRHHLLDQLHPAYGHRLVHVPMPVENPIMLGFEVHRHLAEQVDENYDLYAYFEDDLLAVDPFFFDKINWFVNHLGQGHVLLPQRYERSPWPSAIDKLYIDGRLPDPVLAPWISDPQPPLLLAEAGPGGPVQLETPRNPHAGCFVLTQGQLQHWIRQPWWLDRDCSFITPLESAATLGLMKTFRLHKPAFSHAAWLEVQHMGTGFLGLLSDARPASAQDAPHG